MAQYWTFTNRQFTELFSYGNIDQKHQYFRQGTKNTQDFINNNPS